MLARSVARLTDTASTPATALRALSIRPTQDAQVMPSMGSDTVSEKSVARTGAFIAASLFSFRISSSDRGCGFQPWEGQRQFFHLAALDLASVGNPSLSDMRPNQGDFSWTSELRT